MEISVQIKEIGTWGLDWNAIAAIGTWVATVIALVVAFAPILKRGRIFLTLENNITSGVVMTIINSKDEGMFIEKIILYCGIGCLKRIIFTDNCIEYQNDLLSVKSRENSDYIEPYNKKRIIFEPNSIIHDLQHTGSSRKRKVKECQKNKESRKPLYYKYKVRVVVYTNCGKIRKCTRYNAEEFLKKVLNMSDSFKKSDLTVDKIF